MNAINTEKSFKLVDLVIAGVLAIVSFIVYLITLSAGAFPGESSSLILEYTGILPQYLPTNPLWGGLVWIIKHIPVGDIALRLNFMSAVFGAVVVGLIYNLVSSVIRMLIIPESDRIKRQQFAAILAGVTAALYMAFCIPFWILSTRAHMATFDLMLLLICLKLFINWLHNSSRGKAVLLVFLFALLCVEFATTFLILPVIGIVILLRLWKLGKLTVSTYILLAVAGILGLCLYFISAGIFYGSPGYIIREYDGYFQLLKFIIKNQYILLAHGLPREGWLIIVFLTIVPWLTMLIVGRRGLNDERDFSFYILHIIMTALALLTLFNSKISPWSILGSGVVFARGRILVTPYLLSAILFGYLSAYWYLMPLGLWEKHAEKKFVITMRKTLGPVLAILAVLSVLAMPFFNFGITNGRQMKFLKDYADSVIKQLNGKTWILSDGSVDNQILVAAYNKKVPVKIISLPQTRSELYMRYVAAQFDSVRIKNLARIGIMPMLHEWISKTPDITDKLVIQSIPDLWIGEDYQPLAECSHFAGVKDYAAVDLDKTFKEHQTFWTEIVPELKDADISFEALDGLRAYLLRHLSMVANNLGVMLEDNKHTEQAFAAYTEARNIDTNNISALLNQYVMIDNGYKTPDADAIKKQVDDVIKNTDKKLHVWSLARYYGYIRMPQAFVQMGMNWAMSGKPGLAIAGIKRAMKLAPEKDKKAIEQILAGMYLSDNEREKSEKIYTKLLAENPENVNALLGMVKVELSRNNTDDALKYLKEARATGKVKSQDIALEWASILAVHGNTAKARVVLNELLEKENPPLKAWQLMVAILVQDKDKDALAQLIEQMRVKLPENNISTLMAEGQLALMQNKLEEARDYLSSVLTLAPKNLYVLEMLLKLDIIQGRQDDAEKHAQMLLMMNADNSLANYIMGSIHLQRGDLLLAEDSMSKALENMRSPAILNDLAWVKQKLKKYQEAEKLVDEAIEMNSDFSGAYDTRGVIRFKMGKYQEAEQDLNEAAAMMKNVPDVFFHLAELHLKTGDKEKFRNDIKHLNDMRLNLSDNDIRKLDKLEKSE